MFRLFFQFNQLLSVRDRWQRVGIELAMFLSALLEMAGIGIFVVAVRFFLRSQSALFSWWMLCVVALVLIIKNLFAYWIVLLQANFIYRKQRSWCEALFERYLYGDFVQMQHRSGTDCALSLSRVSLLCDRALLPAMQLFSDGLLVVVLIVALAIYLPYIALSGALFFLAAGGIVFSFFYRKNRQLGSAAGNVDLAAGKLAAQSLDALGTVRAFSVEAFFLNRYAAKQAELSPLRAKLYNFGQAPRLILECTALIYLLGLLGVMLFTGMPHDVILLHCAALIAAFSRLLPAFSRMHYALALLRQYQGIWDDFYGDLTGLPMENIEDGDDFDFSGNVEFCDLVFGYGAEKPILDHINCSVSPGECVGITGRTGSGKSTLFSLLLGFYLPASGEILLDKKPLPEVLKSFRRQTGWVPQNVPLFEDSLRDNLTLGETIADDELWRALKLARIDDFVQTLPGKLDYRIAPDGNNLSGGQKQRLGIARALCRKNVKLLLLDEATSALDAMTEAEIAETIQSLRGKMTILVISHREAALRSCDRIFTINA